MRRAGIQIGGNRFTKLLRAHFFRKSLNFNKILLFSKEACAIFTKKSKEKKTRADANKNPFRNVSKALEASQSSPFNSGTLSSTPKTFRAFSEKILY